MENKALNEKLYESLLDVVGTEDDITSRQEIFRCMDIVNGFGDDDSFSISGGSLSEGFDLKGSDEDNIIVLKNINVEPFDEESVEKEGYLKIYMEVDKVRPGYASLFLSKTEEDIVKNETNTKPQELSFLKKSLQTSDEKCIVASGKFRDQFITPGNPSHGPCISDGDHDFAFSLQGSTWPKLAKQRIRSCKSKGWISDKFLNEILSDGCIYVPVGPKYHCLYDTLWRISFVKSEKRLILSMRHVQWLCYGLLKIVFKEGIGKILSENDIICSYFLKTCLFWLTEETNNNEEIWNKDNLFKCYIMCLEKITSWIESCNCPNYIIPENNMFVGKVTPENKLDILKIMKELKDSGYDGLTKCESLGAFTGEQRKLSEAEREANLDFLVFRVLHVYPFDDINLLKSALQYLETQYEAQKHQFNKGILSCLISTLHQELAQMLRIPDSGDDRRKVLQLQEDHLQKGCRSDRLSGLTLLASFHCTNGEYATATEILKKVTENLTSSLTLRRKPFYTQDEIRSYRENFCGRKKSLEEKL